MIANGAGPTEPTMATLPLQGEVLPPTGSFGKATDASGEKATDEHPTTNPTKAPTEVKPSEPSESGTVRTVPTRYRCGCGEVREFLSIVGFHQEFDWCGHKTWTEV